MVHVYCNYFIRGLFGYGNHLPERDRLGNPPPIHPGDCVHRARSISCMFHRAYNRTNPRMTANVSLASNAPRGGGCEAACDEDLAPRLAFDVKLSQPGLAFFFGDQLVVRVLCDRDRPR